MSTHNICFHKKWRKISILFGWKKKVPYLAIITKTCLYNFDTAYMILTPLNPFYSKTGVCRAIHYFWYFCSKTDCAYSLELPCQGSSNKYPQSIVWTEIWLEKLSMPSPKCHSEKGYICNCDRFLFVLRFYGPVNPMGSCWVWSVYLTTRLLGRLSPLNS